MSQSYQMFEDPSLQLDWDVFEVFKQNPLMQYRAQQTAPQTPSSSPNTATFAASTQETLPAWPSKLTKRMQDESDDGESINSERSLANAKRRSQNRKAQKAFRDRQRRRVEELEQKLDGLLGNYQSLQEQYWTLNSAYNDLVQHQHHGSSSSSNSSSGVNSGTHSERAVDDEVPDLSIFTRENSLGDTHLHQHFALPEGDNSDMLATFESLLRPNELDPNEIDWRNL